MAYETWQDVKPQPGKQERVFQMIANNEVDFMLMGGSRGGGKSELLTMTPLLFCDDPGFRGVFLRREYSQLMGANSIWEKCQNMYPLFRAKPNISDKVWKFPASSNVRLRHLQHDKDVESFRGQGYTFIGIDEIDQFSQESVTFLMTCLRSEAKVNSFMIGTLNPSKSWCLPLVEYYLDEEGFPDPDKFGDIRWFVVKDNEFLFGPSEEYFKEHHPETVFIQLEGDDEVQYVRPKRFTFCFFTILDNEIMRRNNPVYISELQNLPDYQRATQLYGNWYAEAGVSAFFSKEWLTGTDGLRVRRYKDIPDIVTWYRGVDKGYSIPSDTYKHPDPSAISPKIGRDADGFYWIVGDYCSTTIDDKERVKPEKERIYGQFCKLAGERDTLLVKQAKFDGDDVHYVLTKDMGAGTTDHTYTKAKLVEYGIRVIEDASSKNTPDKKVKDFLPFCNACELGLVYIVEESFNPATLSFWYNQLSSFDGSKSNATRKDDQVDAMSLAFAAATSKRSVRTPRRNQRRDSNRATDVINKNESSLRVPNRDGLPRLRH